MLREETQLLEPDLDHTSEGKWLPFLYAVYKIDSHFSILRGGFLYGITKKGSEQSLNLYFRHERIG